MRSLRGFSKVVTGTRKRWDTVLVFAGLGGPIGGATLYVFAVFAFVPDVITGFAVDKAFFGFATFTLLGFLFGLLPAVPTGIAYASLPPQWRHPLLAGVFGGVASLLLLGPFLQIPDLVRSMWPGLVVSGCVAAIACAIVDARLGLKTGP